MNMKERRKTIMIVLGIIAIALIAIVIFVKPQNKARKTASSTLTPDTGEIRVTLTVQDAADKWKSDSTALIVHLQGIESNTEDVNLYSALTYGHDAQLQLPQGKYRMALISAINADHSITSLNTTETAAMSVPEAKASASPEASAKTETVPVITFDTKSLENVNAAATASPSIDFGLNDAKVLMIPVNNTAMESVPEETYAKIASDVSAILSSNLADHTLSGSSGDSILQSINTAVDAAKQAKSDAAAQASASAEAEQQADNSTGIQDIYSNYNYSNYSGTQSNAATNTTRQQPAAQPESTDTNQNSGQTGGNSNQNPEPAEQPDSSNKGNNGQSTDTESQTDSGGSTNEGSF
ncbi:MAG: hypothetical protein LKH11_01950 [Solobacterium sp.]|jgi:hypothetical protein|nr:hypothetical protein [Solobacterium sp.]MCI1435162.1 hypothetical protein [Solobacterium sp.]MCI1459180.1 hypothetical protein [Solobacterium sp.]